MCLRGKGDIVVPPLAQKHALTHKDGKRRTSGKRCSVSRPNACADCWTILDDTGRYPIVPPRHRSTAVCPSSCVVARCCAPRTRSLPNSPASYSLRHSTLNGVAVSLMSVMIAGRLCFCVNASWGTICNRNTFDPRTKHMPILTTPRFKE